MNKLPYSLKYEYYHGVIQDLHSFYLTPTFDVNGFMKTHEKLIFHWISLVMSNFYLIYETVYIKERYESAKDFY